MTSSTNSLQEFDHGATYSPEDNKLRIYPAYRLPKEEYNQLRSAGFKWAPKQELFVAPAWSPNREDVALQFCGEIGDEDTSLAERAEERAERFQGYKANRKADAESAQQGVKSIADNIPFGQPILVGHHSEKRARRDAKKIENGMRKAVKMWKTSKYWAYRAEGVIRNAEYKDRADVRARRIKKLESQRRKCLRNMKEAKDKINLWLRPTILSKQRALFITNYLGGGYYCFPLDKYPRNPPASQYEGQMSLWSALDGGVITPRQARNLDIPALERGIAYNERWVAHLDNRLSYEKAILEAQGASDLLKPKKRPKLPPILNYRAKDGITATNPSYYAEKTTTYKQVCMTKAEYKKVSKDYRGCRTVNGTHRIKTCTGHYVPGILDGLTGLERTNASHRSYAVFLTDSKVHKRPEAVEQQPIIKEVRPQTASRPHTQPERTEFDDMEDALKNGIKTVAVDQLFETPSEVAQKMVEIADIKEGERVLEPSAGTGKIIDAINNNGLNGTVHIEMVEKNMSLVDILASKYHKSVLVGDFLEKIEFELGGKFDKIIMNPPFKNGEDIKHIKHAETFIKPGGRLVALCANGPKQQREIKPLAENSGGYWEDLPQGTFKNSGTMVNAALVVIEG